MRDAVIVDAVRTPVGKRKGALSGRAPGRPVGPRAERAGRADRDRPGGGRRRGLGLRRPGRRADHRHRPQRGAVRGLAGERARHDGGPAVRFLAAVGPLRRGRADRRPVRRRGGGRRRVDEPGADGLRRRAPTRSGPELDSRATAVWPPTRASAPRSSPSAGAFPHPARRVLARLAREGGGRAGRRPVRRPDRAGHARPTAPSSSPTRASAAAASLESLAKLKPAFKPDGADHTRATARRSATAPPRC